MEKWDESIRLALLAGKLFDINGTSEYNRTILNKAIDQYVGFSSFNYGAEKPVPINQALVNVFEQVVKTCLDQNDLHQVIGIAIDARRLDILEAALKSPAAASNDLLYTQNIAIDHVRSLDFQQKILNLLINIADSCANPDFAFICDCLVFTNDASRCGAILAKLLEASVNDSDLLLLAYQIAFDVVQDASQEFCCKVNASALELLNAGKLINSPHVKRIEQLSKILDGSETCGLSLEFLYRASNTDLMILEKSRGTLSIHNSMHHSAVYYSNAIMHAGTTKDDFLRKNLEWLSYASNWAKFSAAASLGMIHKGHISESKKILQPYLPKVGATGSPYSEGGALFALGLIHSKHTSNEIEFIRNALGSSTSEILQHGACLGLGAAAMATHDMKLLEDLKGILYGDNAVAGEAAAIAIGLVMIGSCNEELVEELLSYARETQHEKIIRGLAISIALVFYGSRDRSDELCKQLLADKDVVLRFGGIWTIAMAYAGTSDNAAVSQLLHAAVSESNDDVRRAAVTSLGFVLFQNPSELPQLLELLAGSYNPHVRYGAAMALGIAFSGTGNQEAIDLIKPMCKDLTDFVRQGAYIGLAMILQQTSEAQSEQVAPVRKLYETVAGNKYEDAIAKFGAILSQGIIDAGGRNSVISLASPSGHANMFAIAGTMLFCQFWYWYPCINFIALALQPTAMIGVDGELALPRFDFISGDKPSLFAYPEALKPAETTKVKEYTPVVLSTTAKAKARAKKSGNQMDVDDSTAATPALSTFTVESTATAETEPPKEEKAPEPNHSIQHNLSRVTKAQRKVISFGPDQRFFPVKGIWSGGITLMKDRQPGQPIELFDQSHLKKDNPEVKSSDKKADDTAMAIDDEITINAKKA